MNGEELINCLNRHIEQVRKNNNLQTKGHLVLLRNIKVNSTFKAYSTYECIVFFVQNRKKYKVLECSLTAKVLAGQEERMRQDVDLRLLESIFDFMESDYYKQIINGEYYGGADTE